jgi:hypothetical protein
VLLLALLACAAEVETPNPPRRDPTASYEALLGRIVTDDGLVRYDVLRKDASALESFIGWIAVHGPETDNIRLLDDNRRLAWHLNAYNALVMWGVLQAEQDRGAPLASVRDVNGFFWRQYFGIDGERISLGLYETRVILPTYQEPLSHAALNCASWSCPPLRNELYTSSRLQSQLEDQMRRWMSTEDATRAAMDWDPAAKQFVFSPIFDWYGRDFSDWGGATTPCEAVSRYANLRQRALLDANRDCPHRFYSYEWSLNAAPTEPNAAEPNAAEPNAAEPNAAPKAVSAP